MFADGYDFYDFAEENETTALEIRAIAAKAFSGLGLRGVGRVDFRIRHDGTPAIILLMEPRTNKLTNTQGGLAAELKINHTVALIH